MHSHDLSTATISQIEQRLDSFDAGTRRAALREIRRRIEAGDIVLPQPRDEANLHYHTFFSYNANGWSPARIAWEARKYGLRVAGIVDFDVLDGMEEFLAAGDALELPAAAALETRVFIREYADHVINSPNEPGIAYFMGAGCFRLPEPGSEAARALERMREMARRRNAQVMQRVNEHLGSVKLDYEADVLLLTPSGNATERHLLAAFDARARQVYPDREGLAKFWSAALSVPEPDASALVADEVKLQEMIRSKLMKFGGVGYVAPTPESFPQVETVIGMVQDIEALPTATWLDGTNPGELDMHAMLELLASKGVMAMNIVPDRNWNIRDVDEKRLKIENLGKAVAAAKDLRMPLSVGTEMNKAGLPFVDDFSAPELKPYVREFMDGSLFFWGHTLLARAGGIGCASRWADAHFDGDAGARNEFYRRVGEIAQPSVRQALEGVDLNSADPGRVLDLVRP